MTMRALKIAHSIGTEGHYMNNGSGIWNVAILCGAFAPCLLLLGEASWDGNLK